MNRKRGLRAALVTGAALACIVGPGASSALATTPVITGWSVNPGGGNPTNATTLTFTFSTNVKLTGFTTSDLVKLGTSTGWTIGTPTLASGGGGANVAATYTVQMQRSGGADGTVGLQLKANSVADFYATSNTGPASAFSTGLVTSDKTPPVYPSLDTTPPLTSILSASSIDFSSTDFGTVGGTDSYKCSISTDDVPLDTSYSACSSPFTFTGWDPGIHKLTIRAFDLAGNFTTVDYSWTITNKFIITPMGLSDRNDNALTETIGIHYDNRDGNYIKARGYQTQGEDDLLSPAIIWQRCESPTADTDTRSACTDITVDGGNLYEGWDYVTRRADVGHYVRSCVLVTASTGLTDFNCSLATPVVIHTLESNPTIRNTGTGLPKVGTQVTAGLAPGIGQSGAWFNGYNPGSTFLYQWQKCSAGNSASCTNISSATRYEYTPVASDAGYVLRLFLTLRQIVAGTTYDVSGYSDLSEAISDGIIQTLKAKTAVAKKGKNGKNGKKGKKGKKGKNAPKQ